MGGVDKSDNSVDKSDKDGREDRKPAEKPISLHPLKFEEAVHALSETKPVSKDADGGTDQNSVSTNKSGRT